MDLRASFRASGGADRPQAMFKALRRLHGQNLESKGLNDMTEAFQSFVTRARFFSVGKLRRTWSHSAAEFIKYRRLLPMLLADGQQMEGAETDDFDAAFAFQANARDERKIIVTNISPRITPSQLQSFFSQFGKISHCSLPREERRTQSVFATLPKNPKNCGTATITFKRGEDAQKAKEATAEQLRFYDQVMVVSEYVSRRKGGKGMVLSDDSRNDGALSRASSTQSLIAGTPSREVLSRPIPYWWKGSHSTDQPHSWCSSPASWSPWTTSRTCSSTARARRRWRRRKKNNGEEVSFSPYQEARSVSKDKTRAADQQKKKTGGRTQREVSKNRNAERVKETEMKSSEGHRSSPPASAELTKKASNEELGRKPSEEGVQKTSKDDLGKKVSTETVKKNSKEKLEKTSAEVGKKVSTEELTLVVEKKVHGVTIREEKSTEMTAESTLKPKKKPKPRVAQKAARHVDPEDAPTDFEKVDAPCRPAVANSDIKKRGLSRLMAKNKSKKKRGSVERTQAEDTVESPPASSAAVDEGLITAKDNE